MVVSNLSIVREIRDPLYKYIYLTKMENNIVDSEEFQRLNRLYQTPSTSFVYPNATHTRKSHSLGVMYLADLSFRRLFYRQSEKLRKKFPPLFFNQFSLRDIERNKEKLDDLDVLGNITYFRNLLESIRIAALCHDIGHGPFSHIFEDACKSLKGEGKCEEFKHEKMSAKIISEQFKKYIRSPIQVNKVVDILLGRDESLEFLNRIIDGPYDVDKLDYVSRDAYHTGAQEYGTVDYIRIIDGMRVKDKKLLISSDALNSVFDSFTATQYMYTNLYYHKTVRIFDIMLFEAMILVPDYLNKIVTDYKTFINSDDRSFIIEIKNKRGDSTSENNYKDSYNILKDFMNRKLKYKNIFSFMISLDVWSRKDERIVRISKELGKKYFDLNIKIDYTTKVPPIRIDIEQFNDWMESDNIFNENNGEATNLHEISKTYYDSLKRMYILYYIYMDVKDYNDDTKKETREELCEEARDKLIRIQR